MSDEKKFSRCFDRAIRLKEKIEGSTDLIQRKKDALYEYRIWLDYHKIEAETDGWPSEQAYKEEVVQKFIAGVNNGDW